MSSNYNDKYARLVKSNSLFSASESNQGGDGQDATNGLRLKAKAELTSGRREKRDSCFNKNRFAVDLYDELSQTINDKQKKLKRLIKAVDQDHEQDIYEDEEEDEEGEEEVVQRKPLLDSTRTIAASPSLPKPAGANLVRANTICSSNRRRLLESWKKEREAKEMRDNKRPVFKVCHVDTKDYVLPSTASNTSITSSQFTFKVFVMLICLQ